LGRVDAIIVSAERRVACARGDLARRGLGGVVSRGERPIKPTDDHAERPSFACVGAGSCRRSVVEDLSGYLTMKLWGEGGVCADCGGFCGGRGPRPSLGYSRRTAAEKDSTNYFKQGALPDLWRGSISMVSRVLMFAPRGGERGREGHGQRRAN